MPGFKATNFSGNGSNSDVPISGSAPFTVNFLSLTDSLPPSPPTAWSWDFGDGNTSTLENPTHVYTVPGVYTIFFQPDNGYPDVTVPDFVTVTGGAPTYSLTAADAGTTKYVTDTGGGVAAIFAPNNAQQPGITNGMEFIVDNQSSTDIPITVGPGVTLTPDLPQSILSGDAGKLTKTGDDEWAYDQISTSGRVLIRSAIITGLVKF